MEKKAWHEIQNYSQSLFVAAFFLEKFKRVFWDIR